MVLADGQLQIEVPQEPPSRSTEELFLAEMGTEAFRRETDAYERARRCTCGHAGVWREKWGMEYGHAPGCPRAGERF